VPLRARALDEGKTFYANSRVSRRFARRSRLFHKRTVDADIGLERITSPGAAMLCCGHRAAMPDQHGRQRRLHPPVWPNIFQAAEITGAEVRFLAPDEDWNAVAGSSTSTSCLRLRRAHQGDLRRFAGNPTGWMATREEQRAMLEFGRKRGIAIIKRRGLRHAGLQRRKATHRPSSRLPNPTSGVRHQQLLQSLGDDRLAHRLGWCIRVARQADERDRRGQQHGLYGVCAVWRDSGPLAGRAMRSVGTMLERCRIGRDHVQRFVDGQNRIRWMKPEGAFYGFLQNRGPR